MESASKGSTYPLLGTVQSPLLDKHRKLGAL